MYHVYFYVYSYMQLFKPINITIILNGIVTWNSYDNFTYPRDNAPGGIFQGFQVYMSKFDSAVPYDAAILLS